MRLALTYLSELVTLSAELEGESWRVTLPDGTERLITARRLENDVIEVREGARVFHVPFARSERGIEFAFDGETFAFLSAVPGRAERKTAAATGALVAPMAGVVADVHVTVGQMVAAYQPLAAIEAMKVYATVEAPMAGTVTAVHVAKGERVAQGAPVVDLAPTTAEEESNETA